MHKVVRGALLLCCWTYVCAASPEQAALAEGANAGWDTALACDTGLAGTGGPRCPAPSDQPESAALLQLRRSGARSKESKAEADRLPLVPYPAALQRHGEQPFALSAAAKVVVGAHISESGLVVRTLRDLVSKAKGNATAGSIQLELVSGWEHPEGYSLRVGNGGVLLQAPSVAGLFYGVQTLKQLLPAEGPSLIPAVSIRDHPRFEWRGLHLDVSRHFFTAEQVKSLLESMAAYKLNRFHWHLTDDQGWRLPVPLLPELTRLGAMEPNGTREAYTEEEIRDVVAYAKERNIEVLPEVDVPGHATAAIAAYPELGNTDMPDWQPPTHPIWDLGVHDYTLAPSKKVLDFMEKVFKQLTELFPGQFIHIGGDEAPTGQWSHSKQAQSMLSRSGGTEVQSFFNRQLAQMLKKWNRTFVGWDEVQHIGGLSKDAVIMAWRSSSEVWNAVNEGRRVVNADMERLYFDHYQGSPDHEPKAICCLTRLQEVYDYDPMPSSLRPEQEKLVLGPQAQLWSEYFPTWHQVEYMAFPRSLALAERAWTPPKQIVSYGEFRDRLLARLPDLKARGVTYRELDDVDLITLTRP